MPIPKTCCACLLLTMFSACDPSSPVPDAAVPVSWHKKIAAAAREELTQSGTPSLQIAVAHNGEIIFEGAYGLADVENDVAATPDTRYRTASISKWMTATAAMRLVEQGKLDLDKPVQTYCPEYPEKRWTITVRNLLTHTSGIRHYADYDGELSLASSDAERAEIERRRYRDELGEFTRYTDLVAPLENFKDDPLMFEPGTDWQYTSFGYRVLGCVLEGASRRPYRAIMRDDIFGPANMTGTVDDDAWEIVPHRAAGYRLIDGEPLRRADMRDVSENLPAGGHLTTATDLVSFALAFDSTQLVSEETISLMSRPFHKIVGQMAGPPTWRDAIPSEGKYGYGVMFFPNGKEAWLGHSGQQAGASTIVMLSPDEGLAIAVLTNVKGWRGYISFTSTIQQIVERGVLQSP